MPVPSAKRPDSASRRSAWISSPWNVAEPSPTLRPLYSGGLCDPVIMQMPSTPAVCAAK